MSRPQTPEDQKIMMNEDIEDTPQAEREKHRRAMLGQNRGDNRPSPSMYSAARYIQQVNNLPGITSKSDNRMREMIVEGETKPSENSGGFLEMFGLAGGRRRRRKSRRKSRRRRKRTKKKRRRKSRRKRKRSRRRRRRK